MQLDGIANWLQIAGTIFALFAWLQSLAIKRSMTAEKQRQEQEISVTLKLEGSAYSRSLPVRMKRRELSRAELLGRLGMLPMAEAGKRFSLGYLSRPEFLEQINACLESRHPCVIVIPCSDQEFVQFAF